MFQIRKDIIAVAAAAAVAICAAVTCALWPLNIESPAAARPSVVPQPAPATTLNEDRIEDLKLLDVDLRRPLVDVPAAPAADVLAAAAATSWRLVGTSVDSARPMALLMSPDGTTHWFAAGEQSEDGMEVKRVGPEAATIIVNGHTVELQLPPMPPDPFAAGETAQ